MWSLREIISLFFGKCEVIKKIVLGYRRLTYTWQLVSNPIKTSYLGSSFPVFHILSKIPKLPRYLTVTSAQSEAVVQRCYLKKLKFFFKMLQNSLESICVRVSFYSSWREKYNFIKKGPQHTNFNISYIKFKKIPSKRWCISYYLNH